MIDLNHLLYICKSSNHFEGAKSPAVVSDLLRFYGEYSLTLSVNEDFFAEKSLSYARGSQSTSFDATFSFP